MSDGSVQIAPPGGGQKIDTSQLVQDGSAVVQRQRISIGDPTTVDALAKVDSFGRLNTAAQNIVSVHTNPSVANTTSAILAANANRKYALIQNTTSTPAWIKLDASSAALNAGMFIGPFGSYEMSQAIGNLDTRAINGISTSGTIAFAVTEG